MPAPVISRGRGPTEIDIVAAEGGRLAAVRYYGVDLVLPRGRVPGFYGDTFWPSPQARFEWPPPPALDAGPYAVVAESESGVTLRSEPDPDVGFQVDKHIELSEHGLTIDFTLTNVWDRPQQVAPWQVTRAPRDGLLVWAPGQPFTDADRMQKQDEDPGCWFMHADSTAAFGGLESTATHASIRVREVPRTSKYFTDARGWLAHVHHGTLFLRTFPDISADQAAPRQGELELYFNVEKDYTELENQGAYVTLGPGQGVTYPVQWHFRRPSPGLATAGVTPELLFEIDALRQAAAQPGTGPGC